MGWNIKRRRRSEQGAVTVLFAILVVVIFSVAALGVDIAQQVNRKHLLINQLDSAATAAAAELGAEDGSIASAVASAADYFAESGQGTLDLKKIDFWCVVARKLNGDNTPFNPAMVAAAQIPTTTQAGGICNPDAVSPATLWRQTEYQNRARAWDGQRFSMSCSDTLCAVPCALNAQPSNSWTPGNSTYNSRPITCNTIRVGAEQDVPFSFAGVMGINEGSTGSQIAVACAGSCGSVAPNPMDVVVVADRTLSMTAPLGCTLSGNKSSCQADYREDLVDGITSMLQVMTPEQQFVALGALGPSERTRSTSESNTCNSTGKGLVYPSANVSTSSGGSWVPIQFKNDYLGAADVNGVRQINTTNKLVQAVNCLDDVDATREDRLADTKTALASPLKSAARYLLGKPGDENNVSALGGGNRSGTVKKVIIFETDGEPWEDATTTTGTVSLDNNSDIFSRYTDFTTTTTTSGPVLGTVTAGRPSYISRPSQCPSSGSQCTYQYRTDTTTKTDTRVATGGQKACQNFKQVSALAKQQGILIITIGYNLDGSTMCSGNNTVGSLPGPDTVRGTHYISNITPTACRDSGAGTPANPYVPKSSCTQTITWTVPQTTTVTTWANATGDAAVTDVLADASGGADVPAGDSNGCSSTALIAAENGDDDLFFCAAQGDDLAPLFITALSKVTKGVKLMNLP